MSKVRVNNTVVISYISQAAKPKGGFRIYYRPETTGTTVTSASPSVPVGYNGRLDECVDNLTDHTLTVKLGGLLPLIEIPNGDSDRILYVAFAPVDGSGNIGDISPTVALTLDDPVWDEVFTFTSFPVTLGAEQLTATGSFANGTGWTAGSEWTIGAGVAAFVGAGDNTTLVGTLDSALTVGDVVRIGFNVTVTTGNPNFYIWASAPESRKVNVSTTGTKTVDITITDTAFTTLDFLGINTGGTLTIDNVSVKKIT